MSSAVAANWSGNAWHGVLLRGTIRMVPHGVILRFCVVIMLYISPNHSKNLVSDIYNYN